MPTQKKMVRKKEAVKKRKQTTLELDGKPGKALQALLDAVAKGDLAEDAMIVPLRSSKRRRAVTNAWTPERIEATVREELVAHSLGELLAKARRVRGVSASNQAKALGVSRSQIYQSELPTANLELASLLRHAEALGYNVEVVLNPKQPSQKDERLVAVL